MKFTYDTDRLILRVLNGNNADSVLKFYQDNRLDFEQYEPKRSVNFYTYEFHYNVLNYEYDAMIHGSMMRYYVYKKTAPNDIIGTISLRNITHGSYHKCELGYKISTKQRRQGYAREAIALACRNAFTEMDIHRIEAVCMPWNIPSVKLLENLGFEREGLLRQYCEINGIYEDHYMYSMIRSY